MKDNFKFTLYDVFGYLVPGSLLGVALLLFWWSAFYTNHVAILDSNFSLPVWGLLGLISYLFGHLVQAGGNLLLDHRAKSELCNDMPQVFAAAQEAATRQLGSEAIQGISTSHLSAYMDEYVVQHGSLGDREMFRYREGFYRGMTISWAVLALALLVRSIAGTPSVRLLPGVLTVSVWQMCAAAAISATTAYLYYHRFLRFSEHKKRRILVAYLAACVTPPAGATEASEERSHD